jgi:hypothetical protein
LLGRWWETLILGEGVVNICAFCFLVFSAGFAALLVFLSRVVSGTAMQYAAERSSFKPERRIHTAVAQAGKLGSLRIVCCRYLPLAKRVWNQINDRHEAHDYISKQASRSFTMIRSSGSMVLTSPEALRYHRLRLSSTEEMQYTLLKMTRFSSAV